MILQTRKKVLSSVCRWRKYFMDNLPHEREEKKLKTWVQEHMFKWWSCNNKKNGNEKLNESH